jgi:hypothetical protein
LDASLATQIHFDILLLEARWNLLERLDAFIVVVSDDR